MKKVRLDSLMVERGLCPSPEEAERLVLAHEVKIGDEYASSAAMRVPADAAVWVKQASQYVSRGGVKMRAALDAFGLDVAGMRCIDVGSSTGGFTDCLLQAGAASVTCVDVGYGILDWKLRSDPRVIVRERTNFRLADPADLGAPFDVIVTDLSFIGLASLAPAFAQLSAVGTKFVGLIKPQFESAHDETDHGVVRDSSVRERTVQEVRDALEQAGFICRGVIESPITGAAAGNIEYLCYAVYGKANR